MVQQKGVLLSSQIGVTPKEVTINWGTDKTKDILGCECTVGTSVTFYDDRGFKLCLIVSDMVDYSSAQLNPIATLLKQKEVFGDAILLDDNGDLTMERYRKLMVLLETEGL